MNKYRIKSCNILISKTTERLFKWLYWILLGISHLSRALVPYLLCFYQPRACHWICSCGRRTPPVSVWAGQHRTEQLHMPCAHWEMMACATAPPQETAVISLSFLVAPLMKSVLQQPVLQARVYPATQTYWTQVSEPKLIKEASANKYPFWCFQSRAVRWIWRWTRWLRQWPMSHGLMPEGPVPSSFLWHHRVDMLAATRRSPTALWGASPVAQTTPSPWRHTARVDEGPTAPTGVSHPVSGCASLLNVITMIWFNVMVSIINKQLLLFVCLPNSLFKCVC